MTEKELKKLGKAELVEMLNTQNKKMERLEEELSEARARLEQRDVAISQCGTLSEAALKLSGIFEDADRAAEQYRESIRDREAEADRIIDDANLRAEEIIHNAKISAEEMLAEADAKAQEKLENFTAQFKEFITSHT